MVLQGFDQGGVCGDAIFDHDKGFHFLAAFLAGGPDDGTFEDGGMTGKRSFHFWSGDIVTR